VQSQRSPRPPRVRPGRFVDEVRIAPTAGNQERAGNAVLRDRQSLGMRGPHGRTGDDDGTGQCGIGRRP
jgi:hypothetical protein